MNENTTTESLISTTVKNNEMKVQITSSSEPEITEVSSQQSAAQRESRLNEVINAMESSFTVVTPDSNSSDSIIVLQADTNFSKFSGVNMFELEEMEKEAQRKAAAAAASQSSSATNPTLSVKGHKKTDTVVSDPLMTSIATTSEAATEDLTDDLPPAADGFDVGVKADCNFRFRRMMEDSHLFLKDFAGVEGQGYFAIFDGHGGKPAAKWCSENVHEILKEYLSGNSEDNSNVNLLPQKLALACAKSDSLLEGLMKNSQFGSTAVISLLYIHPLTKERYLCTANIGDARVVLCRNGTAIRISHDHSAGDNDEANRIREMGGFVADKRVNGLLAVTRAFGDFYLKPYVSVKPYTSLLKLRRNEDQYIILACDGLWDVCEDQKSVDLIQGVKNPETAADILLRYALENRSTDNLSIMVVRLDWASTENDEV